MDMTAASLSNFVTAANRFQRSTRLDANSGAQDQLDGYVPTARSLEVTRRLARAMGQEAGVRAMSITGPYGSGKSSLALFLDSLTGPSSDPLFKSAFAILRQADRDLAREWLEARREFGSTDSGFLRAVITAPQREPIAVTVLRALQRGARRSRVSSDIRNDTEDALTRAQSLEYATPAYGEIRELIMRLTKRRPMLLVIDEFGKNLEAFADSGSEGDLYLLQELAEWSSGPDGLPLLLVTIQHLAFDNYVSEATSAQRREWSKVQGRFEDIPYVDSSAATRELVRTSLLQSSDPVFRLFVDAKVDQVSELAGVAGVTEVADLNLIRDCFPLHPASLLVLPDLCARYGQNERTLFSFVASSEPNSVMTLTERTSTDPSDDQWVRLDSVYDYFVESASTFVGASTDHAKWIEVETAIRDAPVLSAAAERVLKTVGILNLVAGRSTAPATLDVVAFSTGLSDVDCQAALEELESKGLLVYREFAWEYRIWRGSDFDISSELQRARRLIRHTSMANLLSKVLPLSPVVAARHSIQSGTTRSFARIYADSATDVGDLDNHRSSGRAKRPAHLHGVDGLLVYNVDRRGEPLNLPAQASGFPVVEIAADEIGGVLRAAKEIDALTRVATSPDLNPDDSVAARELDERIAYARQVLDHEVDRAFGNSSDIIWHNGGDAAGSGKRLNASLSSVLDEAYDKAPRVRNETINRTELTSQGAKARRELIAALIDPRRRKEDTLGLVGDGPEVSMYHALLGVTGIHRDDDIWPPTDPEWLPVWDYVSEALHQSTHSAIAVDHIINQLAEPPFGLRPGPASVLFIAGLISSRASIAIYEHGSYRPVLDAPLTERLIKNPNNFSVKYLAASSGSIRSDALAGLASELERSFPEIQPVRSASSNPTVLTVTLALMSIAGVISDDYTRKSRAFHGVWDQSADSLEVARMGSVRDALFTANDPESLLFVELPRAVTNGLFPASGRGTDALQRDQIPEFARTLVATVNLVVEAKARLSERILEVILNSARCCSVEELELRAADLDGLDVLTAGVKRFGQLVQMRETYTDQDAWMSALTESVCARSFFHWDDEAIPRHLNLLAEVAADYTRVSDLVRFRDGRTEGAFRAFQVQAISDEGGSVRRIVSIPDGMKSNVNLLIERTMASLEPYGLDDREASGALIAGLLEMETVAEEGFLPDNAQEASQ